MVYSIVFQGVLFDWVYLLHFALPLYEDMDSYQYHRSSEFKHERPSACSENRYLKVH